VGTFFGWMANKQLMRTTSEYDLKRTHQNDQRPCCYGGGH
jgi:hypothetical protein